MDTNDPAVEKTELVIKALDYAQSNNLDINNKEDVKKIAEAVDPDNSSEEDIEQLMKLLQGANALMDDDAERRNQVN